MNMIKIISSFIKVAISYMLIIIITSLFLSLPFLLAWNMSMPEIFDGVNKLTFSTAWRILVLFKLLMFDVLILLALLFVKPIFPIVVDDSNINNSNDGEV